MPDAIRIAPRILVTTDFGHDCERAFYHALAFALAKRAMLTILHVGAEARDDVPWEQFPGVRETLTAWGVLAADTTREAVTEQLELGVVKRAVRGGGPRQGVCNYLRRNPTDLLVMASEGRTGLARMFRSSIAETTACRTRSHVLMLPSGGRDLVDAKSGRAGFSRLLLALDTDAHPDLRPVLAYLNNWLPALGGREFQACLLRSGDPSESEESLLPRIQGQTWQYHHETADRTDSIVDVARSLDADLVVVSMHPPPGPLGRLRGTRVDRLLRALGVPLLSIPPQLSGV